MERAVPDGLKVIAHCSTCDNRLFKPLDDTETDREYLTASMFANCWPVPDQCDVCAERAFNGEQLVKADRLRLSCAGQYWDPNGPVAQLMTAEGELDMRALGMDDVAAVIREYDRRLRQTLDKIAFERAHSLVNYLPITHLNRPHYDIDGGLCDMIKLRQYGECAVKEAETHGLFYLGAKFSELALGDLDGEVLTAEHRHQLLSLAEQISPSWAAELRPQLFPEDQPLRRPDAHEVLA